MGEECPFNHAKNPPRLHVWLHVATIRDGKQYIMQLPAQAAPQVAMLIEKYSSLRGLVLIVTKHNSPITYALSVDTHAKVDLDALPQEFNLQRYFLSVWRIPYIYGGEEDAL